MEQKKRLVWLDIMRGLAIICVVICHATEAFYYLTDVFYMQEIRTVSRLFAVSVFTLGRIGVPLFLFISGYLLLGRRYDAPENGVLKFWRKNLLPLLFTVEIWIVLYNLFLHFTDTTELSLENVVRNMLFLNPVGLSHMWYIPMILGMYLFVPFVAKVLQSFSAKWLFVPLIVALFYLFTVPILNLYLSVQSLPEVKALISLEFIGGVYGVYLILGNLTRKGVLQKIKTVYLLLFSALMFVLTVWLQLYFYKNGLAYSVWYNCITLLLCAWSLFEAASRWKIQKFGKLFFDLSDCAFGIFLLHNPIIKLVKPLIQPLPKTPLRVAVLFCVSFFASWLIVTLVRRLCPRAGKILFFAK